MASIENFSDSVPEVRKLGGSILKWLEARSLEVGKLGW